MKPFSHVRVDDTDFVSVRDFTDIIALCTEMARKMAGPDIHITHWVSKYNRKYSYETVAL